MTSRPVNRREMFRVLFGRAREIPPHDPPPPVVAEPVRDENSGELALILDRFCLAHQGTFCSVCVERCPEKDAIITHMGKPRIEPDLCTGCRVCFDVCPAPKKAVFFVSRKPRPGMIRKTVSETTPGNTVEEEACGLAADP